MNTHSKNILVYSTKFTDHSYGPAHPLKVERLQLTMDLIRAYGLFDSNEAPWVEAHEADERVIQRDLGRRAGRGNGRRGQPADGHDLGRGAGPGVGDHDYARRRQ